MIMRKYPIVSDVDASPFIDHNCAEYKRGLAALRKNHEEFRKRRAKKMRDEREARRLAKKFGLG